MTEKVKEVKEKKGLKIFYNIVFWSISILLIVIGQILLFAGLISELNYFFASFFIIAAGMGINPWWHKIKKIKKEKIYHHIRRIICAVLIVISLLIIILPNAHKLRIKNNSLSNSHDEIIIALNKALEDRNYKIQSFDKVEINDYGIENGFNIFEAKIKDDKISIQLIEKNEKIEAVRTAILFKDATSEDGRRLFKNDGIYYRKNC